MTQREKLIELIKEGEDKTPCLNNLYIDSTGKKCIDCERESIADHLLENGVIVPPCKVGTKVYFVEYEEHKHRVFEGSLVSYSLDAAHLWFNCHYACGLNMWHPIEDFGKTVFLTRDKAEKALAERSEGK